MKDLILLHAPEGRGFYLSDSPVALHNDEKRGGIQGNIGLAVQGIQIYVPLTSKLMLAALCPTILERFRKDMNERQAVARRMQSTVTLSPRPLPPERCAEFDREMANLQNSLSRIGQFIRSADDGSPIQMSSENMDFYNSMQVAHAREFVICQHGDFDLAKRYVEERGAGGGGWQLRVG